jgi:hypothetical protein
LGFGHLRSYIEKGLYWTIRYIAADGVTGTKVPLGFVTYLAKVTKINEKSVLTQ